jgi:uncharacterized Ntn-hydrolase superfamily protein
MFMTFSVIGRCARTKQVGLGIATYSLVCGSFAQGAQNPYGIAMTQANVRKSNNPLAVSLMAQGHSPQGVLEILKADDVHHAYRQIAIMSKAGTIAAYTGSKVRPWCGERVTDGCVVFGNGLAGEHVLIAMEAAFLAHPQAGLEERLLHSLEAGRDSGGQGFNSPKKSERSANITVVNDRNWADWDMRVDYHPQAIAELRNVYTAFKPYQPFYNDRDADPSHCLAQDAWERASLHAVPF